MKRIEVKELDESAGAIRFDVQPHRLAIVDELEVVLDVSLRAEDQGLCSDTGARAYRAVACSGCAANSAGLRRRCGRPRDAKGRPSPRLERVAAAHATGRRSAPRRPRQGHRRWRPQPAGRATDCGTSAVLVRMTVHGVGRLGIVDVAHLCNARTDRTPRSGGRRRQTRDLPPASRRSLTPRRDSPLPRFRTTGRPDEHGPRHRRRDRSARRAQGGCA